MPVTTDSNTQKYKKPNAYNKLKTINDQLSQDIKDLYENNVWNLDEKFQNLKGNFEESNVTRDVSWLNGIQYLDYKRFPKVKNKISLEKFTKGEYKNMNVDHKENSVKTEEKYGKRIKFYTKTFEPFKKYDGVDDISWIIPNNRLLMYECIKYHNLKRNVFVTVNADFKTILRGIRLLLGNDDELRFKFAALQNSLSDLENSADDLNKVSTERELGQYVRYVDLITKCDELFEQYNIARRNYDPRSLDSKKEKDKLFNFHQLVLAVCINVYDFPSRHEKYSMDIIKDEKEAKAGKNYVLIPDTGNCKFIFNEIVKTHKPIKYELAVSLPGLSQLNKRLNKFLKESYRDYPRKSLFIKKNTIQGSQAKASASTVSDWIRKEVFKEKNLGVNSFRSSFATYYLPILNNYGKYLMAQRMRTSVEKLYRSYFKIHSSPEDLVKVKIDPEMALQTKAQVGTTSDNAFLVRENMNYNRIKVKKEPGLEDEQVVTPAVPYERPGRPSNATRPTTPHIVKKTVHEKKRERFKNWYKDADNKKKHNERVNKHSKKPEVYARRIVRELNNKATNIQNVNKSTIEKYKIEMKDGEYISGLL